MATRSFRSGGFRPSLFFFVERRSKYGKGKEWRKKVVVAYKTKKSATHA
jgi:hypothetical protein